MKSTLFVLLLCAGCSSTSNLRSAGFTQATTQPRDVSLTTLAQQAISPDPTQSASAIQKLREAGPRGLDAMLRVHADRIDSLAAPPRGGTPSDATQWTRLRAALDMVGQQRDCFTSRLYWHTDIESAQAAARESGKPILSLRLLGKLNEEYSCANSRFFRTTLYANEEVATYLRDHFILHWESVRPVPRITIDFGDGRKLERTITGNSIHYILDAEGRPIDALPGLYGPKAFLACLQRAVDSAEISARKDAPSRQQYLKNYHLARLREIEAKWSQDLAKIGVNVPKAIRQSDVTPVAWVGREAIPLNTGIDLTLAGPQTVPPNGGVNLALVRPTAFAAGARAIGKGAVEAPLLRASVTSFEGNGGGNTPLMGASFATPVAVRSRLETNTSDAAWSRIGALHADQARLDRGSIRLIRLKQPQPTAVEAGRITPSKSGAENPLLRMVLNLERSIAEDTVRNEYLLHSRIHEWLSGAFASADVKTFNEKAYAELFLTPSTDPWLGLAPTDVYAALDGGGLVQASRKP